MKRALLALVGLAAAALANGAEPAKPPPKPVAKPNACLECHLALDDERVTPPAKAFAGDDVHAKAGFTCVFCHGGDPAQEDMDLAHAASKGFRGKPKPREIPLLCGTCHADANVMRHFNPSMRVDQLAEYRTSGHGKRLFAGDERVAECASCHGAHGILPVKDARSPVSTQRIALTCNRCHGDAALMAAYKLPATAYADWKQSVHYRARLAGDLSAPTCNSCHGNHGAAPPEVGSVANVCGTCHSVFADQFKASPHWQPFAELGLPGCVTCHENHKVVKPNDEFLGTGEQSRCVSCHEPESPAGRAVAAMRSDLTRLDGEIKAAESVLRRASEAGMEVSKVQFDLVGASNALTKARADVHRFQAFAVHKTASEGLKIAQAARAAGHRSLAELDFRRKGLFVSLGLILIALAALVLKIRQLDSHRRAAGAESSPEGS